MKKGDFILDKIKQGILFAMQEKKGSEVHIEFSKGVVEIKIRFREGKIPDKVKNQAKQQGKEQNIQ